jgi:2-aminoadipate transaminase
MAFYVLTSSDSRVADAENDQWSIRATDSVRQNVGALSKRVKMKSKFAERMIGVKPSAIREIMKLETESEIISFGGGYPDASLFPIRDLASVFQSTINEHGAAALQYSGSSGLPRLREQIAERMVRQGTICTSDNILILQGAQQGLDLVAKMLLNRGDLVVTERPTFLGALIAFNPYEPRYNAVPMDNEGIDIAELEYILRSRPAKFLYTIPDFQNPAGVTMSDRRRRRLIALANEYDLIVLEDSPYRELRYTGEHLPTLKSLDTEDRVIYLGTFSKTIAPALRLGWAVASKDVIDRLSLLKLAADTQCSTLNMTAVSMFLESFNIDDHIASMCAVYRRKKEIMLDAIRRSFPQEVSFTDPQGGLFTWLTFPQGFESARFLSEHALPEAGVAYVPGATFFPTQEETNHARLSFATQSDGAIEKGIVALGHVLKRNLTS